MVFLVLPFRVTDRSISERDSIILMGQLAFFFFFPDYSVLLVAKHYLLCQLAYYGLLSLISGSWLEPFQKH